MKLSIPDMSCGHCRTAVEKAIEALGGKAEVDLDSRSATLTGIADPTTAINALEAVGFPAKLVT